ncbi:O-antigen ligase family protein [Candidatus Oscillochloris fontis]|uniref:O-antigen ligase family protein n=1 Tax=Candidatus Oscillochloris fontis TaxID=2496868 RepID=UPI00101C361C|nr:O-antigen ligase family protein [Candidatus Oscillochloris fontis]
MVSTYLRTPALVAALAIVLGALVGTASAFGPLYALAGLLVVLAGVALLVSIEAGLITVLATATIIPFGTLPFKAIITPNFLELALAALSVVWVLRILARSDAYDLRVSRLGLPIIGFLGLTFFSLILGARGLPDSLTLHNYAKFVLGVLLFFSMINGVLSRDQARLIIRALLLSGGMAALIALVLVALPDETALNLLVSLGRIGYPTEGRVLRYIEDGPGTGLERAIGLSVDPNSFAGMLALISAFGLALLFARRPLLHRGILGGVVSILILALLLTFSRGALLGIIAAAIYLATLRYHKLWWVMLIAGGLGGGLLVALGLADDIIQRLFAGIQLEDQAQQMRLAEYQNAVAIIVRYPIFGIGFGQAPDIDLTAGVSSIYLAIAQRMGLVGLAGFVGLLATWFTITLRASHSMDSERADWLLGTQAGLVAALVVGIADHYFFNIEFGHMVALFWGMAGLGMAIIALPDEGQASRRHVTRGRWYAAEE